MSKYGVPWCFNGNKDVNVWYYDRKDNAYWYYDINDRFCSWKCTYSFSKIPQKIRRNAKKNTQNLQLTRRRQRYF